MSIVNKPEVSGPLAWVYIATTALVAALALFFVYLYLQTPVLGGLVGLIVIIVVETIIISLTVSLYTTRYTLTPKGISVLSADSIVSKEILFVPPMNMDALKINSLCVKV